MQVGKWRRQITIPTLQTCQNNALTDKNQTRLPRTSAEGNIPRIAVTTGGSDALECLPRRIGLADSEFGTDGSAGRVHLYAGGDGTNSFMAGGNFAAATTLWSSATKLANYDIVVMSCEGSTSKFVGMKPQASIDNVADYANRGGRLFLSHLHFYWLQMKTPDFSGTATYAGVLNPAGAGWRGVDRQPDLPQGHGPGPVAGRANRRGQPDARTDHGQRRRALGDLGQPADHASGSICPTIPPRTSARRST